MRPFALPVDAYARCLGYARAGLDGADWYVDTTAAIRSAASRYDVSAEVLADVLSITSPRVTVKRSVTLTAQYLRDGSTAGVMRSVRVVLERYESADRSRSAIRGPKTAAFAANLSGDYRPVVLDTHMAYALGVEQKFFAGRRYEAAADVVRAVAAELGLTPAAAQAAIWVGVVRERYPYAGERAAQSLAAYL